MKTLLILNDAPYGSERTYDGLRFAHAIRKNDPDGGLIVFLMADAVLGAKTGQATPEGYYNIERMLKRVLSIGGQVKLCGTCMSARGLADADIVPGAARSSMDELAADTIAAEKVVTF